MKILHILNSSSFSGAENVAITIIKQLEKDSNYECYYVSPRGQIEEKLKKEEVKYIPIEKLCRKELKKIIKEYKPDIIHAHDFRASIISALTVPNGIKIISHIHNNPVWIKKINIYSFLYLICSIRFDKILLVSKAIQDEYIFRKCIQKKCIIIGNIINTKDVIEKAVKEKKDVQYDICFNGRLTEQKAPLKFINLIKKIKKEVPNIKAIMIGNGNLKKECEKTIEENNLEENITLIGFLENPYPIMNKSKILCMTSKWEGYGLVAVEALTLSKPVVATNVGGIPGIVDENCGKVCNNDEEMIEEMKKLLKDKKYYENKSKNTKTKLEKINDLPQYIIKLKKIYEID